MKHTDIVKDKLNRLPNGHVFTASAFYSDVKSEGAVTKALNRMAGKGLIVKLAKGKFYKPEKTPFGEIKPDINQVVKDLLEQNGKTTGYLTGLSVYSSLGLTTQVSNTIQIGKNEIRPAFKRGIYTISFIKQKNTITRPNIPFLQMLDAVRYIKKIPDMSIQQACRRLRELLKEQQDKDIMTLVRLSIKYSPATRALCGVLLSSIGKSREVQMLKQTLNPLTTYTIPGVADVIRQADEWGIR